MKKGTVLQGRYEILDTVGVGGSGAVYKARHLGLKTEVAIKEMVMDVADPQERDKAFKRFQREAQILASLAHTGLVRVSDFFTEDDAHYLVMDFIEGETLDTAVAGMVELPEEAAVIQWMIQVCDVLQYLHSHNPPIIFRDLKPANIMVDKSGRVRLIDFGIARAVEGDGCSGLLKGLGTAGYAPPEQYGSGGTDARSDLYALGATMYALLTRQVPPPSVTIMAEPQRLTPIRTLNPKLSPQIDNLIQRCMALKREDRYASAAEVRTALSQLRPVLSQDPGMRKVALDGDAKGDARDRRVPYCQTCGRVVQPGQTTCGKCDPRASYGTAPKEGFEHTPTGGARRTSVSLEGGPAAPRRRSTEKLEAAKKTVIIPLEGSESTVKPPTLRPAAMVTPPDSKELVETRDRVETRKSNTGGLPPAPPKEPPKPAALPDSAPAQTPARTPNPARGNLLSGLLGLFKKGQSGPTFKWSILVGRNDTPIEVKHLTRRSVTFHCRKPQIIGPGRIFVQGPGFKRILPVRIHSGKQLVNLGLEYQADVLEDPSDLIEALGAALGDAANPESRRAERKPRTFQVLSSSIPGYRALSGDLSLTGLKLWSPEPLAKGTIIEMSLDLDDARLEAVKCKGEIMWCRPEDKRHAMGVRFIDLSEAAQNTISSYLESTWLR